MSSSDSTSVVPNVNVEQDSHFMRLSTEIREMIYRPLLIARHAMMEPNVTSGVYNCNRRDIQNGPDQSYVFETAILATNRRIHEEAKDLCRRENDFVCLTSQQLSSLGYEIEELGLQMITRGSRARGFWNISMSLTLDPAAFSDWPHARARWCRDDKWEDASEDGRPWNYIFCSEELPEFCRLLLKLSRNDHNILQKTVLYININPALLNGQATDIDSNPAGQARMRKLLDPLRQLHGLGAAQIDGPLSGSYKGYIITSICRHCPTAWDIVSTTMAYLIQGDQQASEGQLRLANLRYKAALSLVLSCCWRNGERDFIMDGGPFPELEASQTISNIVVRLQARIAAVYLKGGKLRMARIYTERALDPRRKYDHRHNKMDILDIEPWQQAVYAEVRHVAAKISYAHGDVHEARHQLWDANRLEPFNEEEQARYEAWGADELRLRARQDDRRQARKMDRKKRIEKAEAKIQVVCNWKNKGDRLLQSGRSILATSVYQTALNKIDLIKRDCYIYFEIRATTFQGYGAVDAMKALTFKLQAGLAAAGLMSGKYQEVIQLTDSVLMCKSPDDDCVYGHCGDCNLGYSRARRDWANDQKLDYQRLHSSRALALHHLGDPVHAIEHMEKALGYYPRDRTVFAQLARLKQISAAQKRRAEKLNAPQDQLRKKQEKRRSKAQG